MQVLVEFAKFSLYIDLMAALYVNVLEFKLTRERFNKKF